MNEEKNWWQHLSRQTRRKTKRYTHPVVILIKIFGHHWLVPRQRFLEVRECIAGDAKRGRFNVVGVFVEPGGMPLVSPQDT